MHLLKTTSRALTYLWALSLILLAVGLVTGKLTISSGTSRHTIDAMAGLGCVLLAALTILQHITAIIGSSIIFALCAAIDGWGLLVKQDPRYWPGAAVALFGAVFLSVKYAEHKTAKEA